jgi:hypothetical protein
MTRGLGFGYSLMNSWGGGVGVCVLNGIDEKLIILNWFTNLRINLFLKTIPWKGVGG